MEEEKKNKISLSTYVLILAILIIAVMAVFIYMQKVNSEREIAGLKGDAEELKATVNELQGKLDNISNIASTSEENNNSEKVSTENVIQEISDNGYTAKLENDTVTITLKNQNGLWTDSDFNEAINNKTYTVSGLKNGIKKIVAANRAHDVSPEVLILMDDGSVYSVELTVTVLSTKNPEDIKFVATLDNKFKDIVDIYDYREGNYATDKNGNKIELYSE